MAPPPDGALFEGGPPLGLERRLGLNKGSNLYVGRRMLLVVLIGWVPLIVLTIVQSVILHTDRIGSLVWEVGAHACYLLAAPLLILAETECAAQLSAIVRHFIDGSLVPDEERERFDAAISSTRKLLGSTSAAIVVVVLAYGIMAATAWSTPMEQVPVWHRSEGGAPIFSPAGWWHVLVSLPLLLILVLGWLSRLAMWSHLLWRISRLRLRLVASHPDRAAGLGFVGHSVRAFAIVALALMTIAAGRSAHIVLEDGTLRTPQLLFNGGLMLSVAAMFTAPSTSHFASTP